MQQNFEFSIKAFDLYKKGAHDTLNLPKFSIARGCAIGTHPSCLKDVTITERLLTSLSSFLPPIFIALGGWHKAIREHVFVFDSYPQEISRQKDTIVHDNKEKPWVLTNSMTLAQ